MGEIEELKNRVASLERQVELLMMRDGPERAPALPSNAELEIIMRRSAITRDMSELNRYYAARGRQMK